MSASTEIIRRLLERGLTGQAIGQAIGRDRSLVSQVGRGIKPGATLEGALSELERRVVAGERPAVTQAPARRVTRAGTAAKVRRPTTIGKPGRWRTSTIKRQAASSGGSSLARSLGEAADDGGTVKVTIVYDKSVIVIAGGSGKRGRPGPGGTVEMEVDPDDFDGTMSAVDWLNSVAADAGYIGSDVKAGQVETIEMRVY